MKRIKSQPRANWQNKVENLGFVFHTIEGEPYWDETAFYLFTSDEISEMETATNTLSSMYQFALAYAIDKKILPTLGIPEHFVSFIESGWRKQPPSIYGRLDLAYKAGGPPKLIEFNADTPTSLLEASIIQWDWLQDVNPRASQWNSLHEQIIESWKQQFVHISMPLWFACCYESQEDYMTMTYLRDLANQAGIETKEIDMCDIGWCSDRRSFVDLYDKAIHAIFKLYPWDWIVNDPFGRFVADIDKSITWIEPPWKMLANSKAMLALLWSLFPDHEYLLPCYIDDPKNLSSYAEKPFFSREGSNIRLVHEGNIIDETGGEYKNTRRVFQDLYAIPQFDGNYPIFGSWLVDGKAAGLGIRETKRQITDGSSRFIPHAIQGY